MNSIAQAALDLVPEGKFERARLARAGRLWVLETRGDGRARGLQHGALLARAIRDGAVPLLAARAAQLPASLTPSAAAEEAWSALTDGIYADIRRDVPVPLLAEIAGLAEGAGLSEDALFRASFLSEALQRLVGLQTRDTRAVANGACTAAVISGQRADGMGSIHAKNQDYDGIGSWDRQPLVHIAHPEEGLAHASATSAGLLKGNLAINAAGVSVGGHFLFSDHAGGAGLGLTALEREVALRAENVGQALEIISCSPIMGAFALVVTDAAGAAAVAECDGRDILVRRPVHDRLAMSNLYRCLDGCARDLLPRWMMHRNPGLRQQRVETLLADISDAAGAPELGAILADRTDAATRTERGPAHLVAQATTVTAAIAETGSRRLWVGEAVAPASCGRFIGFDLAEAFACDGPVGLAGSFVTIAEDDPKLVAFRRFLEARAAFVAGRHEEAVRQLGEAEAAEPAEPAYPRFLARLLLRTAPTDEALCAAARRALDRSMRLPQGRNELAECLLLKGLANDLSGQRAAACADYAALLELAAEEGDSLSFVSPALESTARRWSDAAPKPGDASRLPVSFELMAGFE